MFVPPQLDPWVHIIIIAVDMGYKYVELTATLYTIPSLHTDEWLPSSR